MSEVPLVAPKSRVDMDRWGCMIVARHYPDLIESAGQLPVIDLLDVLLPKHHDIDVGIGNLPIGVEGITEPPNLLTISTETYDGLIADQPHARFTGAHEATHALLHLRQINARYESVGSVRMHRRERIVTFRDPEWQANRGGAALLMPAIPFWRAFGPRAHDVDPAEVAEAFGVSYTAAKYRLDDALSGRMWRPHEN